jgi:uncharacterized RDD family membrane protein YckC
VTAPIRSVEPAEPHARRLITPEGLDLRLTLASAGERASAFLLDALIVLVVLVVMFIGLLSTYSALRQDAVEALAIFWLVGFFLLRNFYFTLFELSGRAATPGKRAMGLRVVARDGGRLTAEAILTRNALREIELFLPISLMAASGAAGDPVEGAVVALALIWSGTFLLFPLFNRDRLRVGDLLAGTWVVRAPRPALLPDLARAAALSPARFAFTPEQTGAYGVKELGILEEVLRRREAKTLGLVATRIRTKIDFVQPPDETDAAFLEAYYAALRARLEHGLLFGRRRKDKFDVG